MGVRDPLFLADFIPSGSLPHDFPLELQPNGIASAPL